MANSNSFPDPVLPGADRLEDLAAVEDKVPAGGQHGQWLSRLVKTLRLTRSQSPPTFWSALGLVMVAFILAGTLQVYGVPAGARYTSGIAFLSEGVVRWLEPVPLGIDLQATGSIIRASSDLLRVADVTSFDTSVYFFYLPFITILLALAAWRFRLVSLPEIAIILGMIVVVHVACTSLRILWGEAASLSSPLVSLVAEWEFVILQRLARVYYIYGIQLWSGLAVALVLLRGGRTFGRSGTERLLSAGSAQVIGLACFIFLLPALSFIVLTPPLRRITGHGDRAATAVALNLATAGRHGEAYDMYTKRSHVPTTEDLPVLLALAQLAMDDDQGEAEKFYQRVLLLDPAQPAANLYMGGRMGRLGRFEEAAQHYQTALQVDAKNPDILYQLGNCYLGMGDLFTARSHYQQVVDLRPRSPRALAKLGRIHAATGEPCLAMAVYSRCLALAPDPDVADDVRRRRQRLESRCPEGERPED